MMTKSLIFGNYFSRQKFPLVLLMFQFQPYYSPIHEYIRIKKCLYALQFVKIVEFKKKFCLIFGFSISAKYLLYQ